MFAVAFNKFLIIMGPKNASKRNESGHEFLVQSWLSSYLISEPVLWLVEATCLFDLLNTLIRLTIVQGSNLTLSLRELGVR